MIYLNCFWEFFQVGLFAVGGGLATIPFLQDMAGRHPTWFTLDELQNFVAVAESTPGPIGINIATYAGYKIGSVNGPVSGVLTALLCTLSLVLPSFIIIVLIAKALQKFKDNFYVNSAFYGIRPATTALILSAVILTFGGVLVSLGTIDSSTFTVSVNYVNLALFAVVLTGTLVFKKMHPLVFIAFGAVAGIILKL